MYSHPTSKAPLIALIFLATFSSCKRDEVTPAAPTAPAELVVCSWGGSFQDAQRKAFFKPFQDAKGVHVKEASYDGDYGKLLSMVRSGQVLWDVVDVDTAAVLRGQREGILEPLTGLSLASEINARGKRSHAIATDFFTTVLSYSTQRFPVGNPQPASWKDFWDVKKFPGPRSLRRSPRGTLEFALLADGVSADKLYPLDVDRAFRSLDRIKGSVVLWWTSGHQPVQALASGDVVMAAAFNGRLGVAILQENAPLDLAWEGGALEVEWWVIPKHAPHIADARRFIEFASRPEAQAALVREIPYGPIDRRALAGLDPRLVHLLPTAPDNESKQFVIDSDWWAANEQAVTERFNAWLVK
jgi:putative spermidine/putrescine transport system substrate-binding protein